MITITKREEVVLDQIKIFFLEYPEGIPFNVLKTDTGFHEYDLVDIIGILSDKGLIEFKDNFIKLLDIEKEINTVNSRKDVEDVVLKEKERETYELLQKMANDNNLVSKYILEGQMLYGDLKLTHFRMFHILLSLENKGLVKPVKKDNWEYYLVIS